MAGQPSELTIRVVPGIYPGNCELLCLVALFNERSLKFDN